MIFQHTWHKITTDEKTETSRIAQDSDQFTLLGAWSNNKITPSVPMSIAHLNLNHSVHSVIRNGRTLYHVGQVLSVQPARTKPAIWWREEAFGLEFAHEDYTIWNSLFEREAAQQSQRTDYQMLGGNSKLLKEHGYQPLQIRITRIQLVDVRQMTHETALREGFTDVFGFWETWTSMHDHSFQFYRVSDDDQFQFRVWHERKWQTTDDKAFNKVFASRPAERYRAWSLQFEVLR